MSLKKKLAASSAWTIASSLLNNIAGFLVFVVLARILSPAEFGIVAFATIFIEVGRVIVVAGISDALVQRRDWDNAVATTGFWVNLLTGIVLSALLCLGSAALSGGAYGQTFILVLAALSLDLVIEGATAVHVAKMRREFRYKEIATRGMATRIVSSIVGVTLAYAGFGVWALVISRLIGSAGAAVILVRLSNFRPRGGLSFRHARSLAPFAMGQLGTQLLSQLNAQASGLVVGALLGPAAVAQFRVGSRALGIMTSLVIAPLQQTALSAFARLQDRENGISSAYLRVTRACALLSYPTFFGLAAVAPDFIRLVFGPQWTDAGYVMIALALVGGPATLNYFQNAALASAGRAGLAFWATAMSSAGNLLAALITFPFGVIWVAAAQTARSFLTLPFNLAIVQRALNVRPRDIMINVLPPYLCGLLMFALVTLLRMQVLADTPTASRLMLCIGAGGLIYALAIWFGARRYLIDNLEEVYPLLPQAIRRRLPAIEAQSARRSESAP